MRLLFSSAVLLAASFATTPSFAQFGGGGGGGGLTGVGDASTANQPSTIGLGSVSSPGYYGPGWAPYYGQPSYRGRSVYRRPYSR